MYNTSKRQDIRIKKVQKGLIFLIALVGVLEAVGVLSVSFGLSAGDSILVTPIASALTIVTVGLAMIFLKEKITKTQLIGIFLTILGIIITAF